MPKKYLRIDYKYLVLTLKYKFKEKVITTNLERACSTS